MINKEVFEHVKSYVKNPEWLDDIDLETSNGYDFLEVLENFDIVHSETESQHRWYDVVTRVCKIGDKFIAYPSIHSHSETTFMGDVWDDISDLIKFVEPYTIEVTKYK